MLTRNQEIKIWETLKSSNFLISLIALILLVFKSQGIVDESLEAEEVYAAISRSWEVLMIYIVTPINKIAKSYMERGWSWQFLGSKNFIMMAGSTVTIVVAAAIGQENAGMLLAAFANMVNMFYHFRLPTKNTEIKA